MIGAIDYQKLYSANNWIATSLKYIISNKRGYQKLYSANNWIATSLVPVVILISILSKVIFRE